MAGWDDDSARVRRPAGPVLLESAELESQGWEVGHRLKGRVIPRKSLCDNDLRQLSRKTVTNAPILA